VSAAPPHERFLTRHSFIELPARERARAILDADSFRELLGPFDRLKSPWLPLQGVVAQSDDGVVIARGRIGGRPAVVAAIEGAFQGGSIGEVSGSKVAGALELALRELEFAAAMASVVETTGEGGLMFPAASVFSVCDKVAARTGAFLV